MLLEKYDPVHSLMPFVKPREELTTPHEGIGRAVALYNFDAVEVANLFSMFLRHHLIICLALYSPEICPFSGET